MEKSGLRVISKTETENWKTYQIKVYSGILKHKEGLLSEMGDAANILISEANTVPSMLNTSIRRLYHTAVDK